MKNLPEVWLRGPIENVNPYLQPVVHALMQASEEITLLMDAFPDDALWKQPSGVGSVGFHLQHIVGVLDRMLTYAQGSQLSTQQLTYLQNEGVATADISPQKLVDTLQQKIRNFIAEIKGWNESALTKERTVGRQHLPSTVLGLLFHAAEHTMRHTGQLLVTVQMLKGAKINRGGEWGA